MNLQRCRVQMLRQYFGEEPGEACGLCDSCAGLDSEMFDPGDADARHSLHAATDFHGRTRRRRRRGADKAAAAVQAPRARPMFATPIPEVMPATVPPPWVPPPESEANLDPSVWDGVPPGGAPAAGEVVLGPGEAETWAAEAAVAAAVEPTAEDAFAAGWVAVRDANIRPFVEWIAPPPISLPVVGSGRSGGGGAGNQQQRPQQAKHHPQGQAQGQHGGESDRKRRRRRRRGRHHGEGDERPRGPRLPGVYNPGGD
jgi:hypothetical protein